MARVFCVSYVLIGTSLQNAPQRFRVILVATELDAESASVNLEIARQFAAEKHLELLECDFENQEQVDSVFLRLIDRVMSSWESNIDGRQPGSSLCSVCLFDNTLPCVPSREHSVVTDIPGEQGRRLQLLKLTSSCRHACQCVSHSFNSIFLMTIFLCW